MTLEKKLLGVKVRVTPLPTVIGADTVRVVPLILTTLISPAAVLVVVPFTSVYVVASVPNIAPVTV